MTLISIITLLAIPLNLGGVIPHIMAMLRSRSAAGQSPYGWAIGIMVNTMFGVVNLIGLGEVVLGLGSFAMALLCGGALGCVLVLPKGSTAATADAYRLDGFQDLATAELEIVSTTARDEHERRLARRAAETGVVTA